MRGLANRKGLVRVRQNDEQARKFVSIFMGSMNLASTPYYEYASILSPTNKTRVISNIL